MTAKHAQHMHKCHLSTPSSVSRDNRYLQLRKDFLDVRSGVGGEGSSVNKVLGTHAWHWSSDPQNPSRNRYVCICNPNIQEAEIGDQEKEVAS